MKANCVSQTAVGGRDQTLAYERVCPVCTFVPRSSSEALRCVLVFGGTFACGHSVTFSSCLWKRTTGGVFR